jgi:hypothetical protein
VRVAEGEADGAGETAEEQAATVAHARSIILLDMMRASTAKCRTRYPVPKYDGPRNPGPGTLCYIDHKPKHYK